MPKSNPYADAKINLAYVGSGLSFHCQGFDTVTAQVANVYAGDMQTATLTHRVSNDGLNWIDGFFTGLEVVTANGTQADSSEPINVQGWKWYRCEVSVASSSNCWVLLRIFGKNNTGGY